MRISRKNMLLALLNGLILVGCATSGVDDNKLVNSDNRVDISGNQSDASNLQISKLHSVKLNNIFKAQATIYNKNRFTTAQVYYRCNFYDEALFKLQDEQQWIPVQILAKQSEVIQCSTTNPDAATFKVEISSSGRALNANK